MRNCKRIMIATFLVTASYTGVANAHDQTGSLGSSKSGAAATDVYEVKCFDDGSGEPAKLFVQVTAGKPLLGPLVTIQLSKDSKASPFSTDAKGGDKYPSPGVSFKPLYGAGVYLLTVNKALSTLRKVVPYGLQFHCQTASNGHTGTEWILTQNQ